MQCKEPNVHPTWIAKKHFSVNIFLTMTKLTLKSLLMVWVARQQLTHACALCCQTAADITSTLVDSSAHAHYENSTQESYQIQTHVSQKKTSDIINTSHHITLHYNKNVSFCFLLKMKAAAKRFNQLCTL